MSFLSADEVTIYLSMQKPAGGSPGSPEHVELNKWHYAKVLEGIGLMRDGHFQASEEERTRYIDENTAVLAMIESELLEHGLARSER